MIPVILKKISQYARELGAVKFKIEDERITNPGHEYNKKRIGLEAKIELLEELYLDYINNLKNKQL